MPQIITNQEKQQLIPGGWTPFRGLTPKDMLIFDEATKNIMGVKYTPRSVSTQVVEGVNYNFLCDSKIMSPNAEIQKMMVYIYQPLQGAPEVTSIIPLHEPNSLLGGWSKWISPVDSSSQQVFDDATYGLLGVKYIATAASKQVVAGTNYMFKCNATTVTSPQTKYKVMMEIFQPLEAGEEPVITSIITSS